MNYTFHAPYIDGIKKLLQSGYDDNYLNSGIIFAIKSFDKAILDEKTKIYGSGEDEKAQNLEIEKVLGHLPSDLSASDYLLYAPEYPDTNGTFQIYMVLRGSDNKRYVMGGYTMVCDEAREISLTEPVWSGISPLQIQPITEEMVRDLRKGPKKLASDPLRDYGNSMGGIGDVLKKVGLGLIEYAGNSGGHQGFPVSNNLGAFPGTSIGFPGTKSTPPFSSNKSSGFRSSGSIPVNGPMSFSKERVRELLIADREKRNFTWFDRMRNGGISNIRKFDEMIEKIALPIYSSAKSQNPSMPSSPIWQEIENQALKSQYIVSNCNHYKKEVDIEKSRCVYEDSCDQFRRTARGGCAFHEIMPVK